MNPSTCYSCLRGRYWIAVDRRSTSRYAPVECVHSPPNRRASAPASAPGDTCTGAARRRKCRCTPARSGSSPGLSRCMAAPSTFGVAAGLVYRAMIAHLGRAHIGVGSQVAPCPSFTLANRADCRACAASTRARIVPNVGRRRLSAALVAQFLERDARALRRGCRSGRGAGRRGASGRLIGLNRAISPVQHGAARAGVFRVAPVTARTRILGANEHEIRREGQAAAAAANGAADGDSPVFQGLPQYLQPVLPELRHLIG